MERGHNGNPARLAEHEWCFTYEPEQKNECKGASGRKLRQVICDKFSFASLEFQTLEGVIRAIGLPACELCTYCWNGKE